MQLLNPFMRQKVGAIITRPWFFPVLICVLVNGLGMLLTFQTELSPQQIKLLSISFEKHNTIMSVAGSSLVTLIAVSFSISMLILSNLSNQFGPRLLPNILHCRITQVTLGFFLATFLFSLFCIYFDSSVYTRAIQAIYILILTIICITILVFFVNYVINSIQVDYILRLVQSNTKKAIKTSCQLDENEAFPENIHKRTLHPSRFICIKSSGYVQGIDYQQLKKLARDHECFIEIKVRPGDFILAGQHAITLYQPAEGDDVIDERFRTYIRVGQNRELTQDIEFGYEQIAEIAVRALSPGINDPYTARHCVWVLADLFIFIEQFQLEVWSLYDDAKWVGWCRGFTFEGLVHASLDRFRQAAKEDFTVLLAAYDMIAEIVPILKKRQLIRPLMQQGKSISEMIATLPRTERDKSAIEKRYNRLAKIAKQFDFDWWFSEMK